MNNSNQYDELLIKYLADDLDAEEKSSVESWIHASEENWKYFEELRQVWSLAAAKQALEKVNVEEEWNTFQETVAAGQARVVSIDQMEEDGEEERPGKKPVVYRLLVGAAIAASVLFVVGLGWKLFVSKEPGTPLVQKTNEKTDSLLYVLRHEVNTTGKDKRIQLPDGSLIVLAHNSEITYREPFRNSRDITLTGKASFSVAKDESRPFKVESGAIATTALGTEFTVTAFADARQITVRLYEGKVVVKPVEKEDWRMKKDFYLSPGQEFVYDQQSLAKIRSFKTNDTGPGVSRSDKVAKDNPALPQSTDGSWYMFNNQSLGQVLDDLEAFYNVEIIYNKKDVQNITWTGNYKKSDSLETILARIGIVHNLTVTRKDSAFMISK